MTLPSSLSHACTLLPQKKWATSKLLVWHGPWHVLFKPTSVWAECHLTMARAVGRTMAKTEHAVVTAYNHDTVTDHGRGTISNLTLLYLSVQTGPMKPVRE